MVALAALAAAFGERWLDPQSLALFFVVPTVLAAMNHGIVAALSAALLSVAAINFMFVEPRYTWAVARPQDAGALILFALVGVLVSIIAERARAGETARLEASRERFKSELLASVSHDLRTPLATIVFALQSLKRFAIEHSAPARAELVELAEAEARRLSQLVEKLLNASRLEAGRMPVQIEAVSLSDILVGAVEEAKREFADAIISVTPLPQLPLIAADPVLATNALANVVSNAAKYAAGSPISIEARHENHNVVIDVGDRGPGLGDDPDRLFEKFVRGVFSDGRAPGVGLGLTLARSFMEFQGGSLTARNREGGGAMFSLAFPCWTATVRHVG